MPDPRAKPPRTRPPGKEAVTDDAGDVTLHQRLHPRVSGKRVEVPTLRVVAGRDMLSYVTLRVGEEVILGRDEAAGMILTDALVSRRHARVTVAEDQTVTIQDLGSTNGTSVNGVAISRSLLAPGDHLEVGGVSLRLDLLSSEEIEHLANVVARLKLPLRDPLTGLLTRVWLDEELAPLMERCARSQKPLACIFFDLDGFKEVNDRFGHHIGDDVLVGCARLVLFAVRNNDPCVRYGGEEIVMFLAHADQQTALDVAERVRKEIHAHDWDRTAPGLTVSVSAGIASWKVGEARRDWMARADAALLTAKREGRNRIVIDRA